MAAISDVNMSDILVEFLEVAINSILFYRGMYPETIFVLKRKFGISVNISIYPQLNDYITECLRSLRELIQLKRLKRIGILFSDEQSNPIEQFVFNILHLKTDVTTEEVLETSDPYFIKLQELMRAFILKLSVLDTSLKRLQDNCTFKMLAYTTESAMISVFENPVLQVSQLGNVFFFFIILNLYSMRMYF